MENSWKLMPKAIKVVFVLEFIGLFLALMQVTAIYNTGLTFFGEFIDGIKAVNIFFGINIVLPVTFLIGTWGRQKWGLIFCYFYFIFGIIMGLGDIYFIDTSIVLLKKKLTPMPELTDEMIYTSQLISIILGCAFNLICLIFIYKYRAFFNPKEE